MSEEKTLQEATEVKKPVEKPKTKTSVAYRCKTRCFFNGHLYKEGEKTFFESGLSIPEHFVKES